MCGWFKLNLGWTLVWFIVKYCSDRIVISSTYPDDLSDMMWMTTVERSVAKEVWQMWATGIFCLPVSSGFVASYTATILIGSCYSTSALSSLQNNLLKLHQNDLYRPQVPCHLISFLLPNVYLSTFFSNAC